MIKKLLFPKAYKEVLEILKYIPKDDYNKIPKYIINNMKKEMDKDYSYEITNFDDFNKIEMLKETETILAVFYRDYWATPEQREKIKNKEKYDIQIQEEEKRKKYNPDNLFKNTSQTQIVGIKQENSEIHIVEYKETFFIKFKKFIYRILHKDYH